MNEELKSTIENTVASALERAERIKAVFAKKIWDVEDLAIALKKSESRILPPTSETQQTQIVTALDINPKKGGSSHEPPISLFVTRAAYTVDRHTSHDATKIYIFSNSTKEYA